MPKTRPLPIRFIPRAVPTAMVAENPPPVKDKPTPSPFTVKAAELLDAGCIDPAVTSLRPGFYGWLDGKHPTKRKAREYLATFAGRSVSY